MEKRFICWLINISSWKFNSGMSIRIPSKYILSIFIVFYLFPFFSIKIFCIFINASVNDGIIFFTGCNYSFNLSFSFCFIYFFCSDSLFFAPLSAYFFLVAFDMPEISKTHYFFAGFSIYR